MNEPYEVRFDPDGHLYVVEMRGGGRAEGRSREAHDRDDRRNGNAGFGGDGGPATRAQLRQPHSIALRGGAELYIADIGNHRIRRVTLADGRIDTVAGTGDRTLPKHDSIATGKPMLGPRALYVRGETLWIALREGHSIWANESARSAPPPRRGIRNEGVPGRVRQDGATERTQRDRDGPGRRRLCRRHGEPSDTPGRSRDRPRDDGGRSRSGGSRVSRRRRAGTESLARSSPRHLRRPRWLALHRRLEQPSRTARERPTRGPWS